MINRSVGNYDFLSSDYVMYDYTHYDYMVNYRKIIEDQIHTLEEYFPEVRNINELIK